MGTTKIGLALSGGAALGSAHIGVLQAFEEHNLPIHKLAGTSVGALIGVMHAFGKSCEEMTEISHSLDWMDIGQFKFSRFGILSNSKMQQLVHDKLEGANLEDARIPISIVATNIANGDKVIFDSGPADIAVAASTCIPGVFSPVQHNDLMLVDGGIVENIPVSPLQTEDVDVIVAVDLNSRQSYQPPENIFDVLFYSFHFIRKTTASLQASGADVMILPRLASFSKASTSNTDQLIEKGYEAAMEAIKNNDILKQLVAEYAK